MTILTILLGVFLIFLGTISAFLLKSISGYLVGGCSVLNGIAMIVSAICNRNKFKNYAFNSEEIADYILEVTNDLGLNITYNDLGNLLFLAQSFWWGEFEMPLFTDGMFRFDETPTTIRVDKLYGDEDVIKTKPIHRDIGWINGFMLVNLVVEYKNMKKNADVMDKLRECINRIDDDGLYIIRDFCATNRELKPYISNNLNPEDSNDDN